MLSGRAGRADVNRIRRKQARAASSAPDSLSFSSFLIPAEDDPGLSALARIAEPDIGARVPI